ncbi:MAG: DUF4301 family protein, partial [Bacteroidales bacterium]|nr:DUF4301 family protein [Bacteroidales bacterium]
MHIKSDIEYFKKMGINTAEIDRQIECYKKGFPFMQLVRPATINDGIRKLTEAEVTKYVQKYVGECSNLDVLKFVPASGAASRMFKDLFVFVSEFNNTPE